MKDVAGSHYEATVGILRDYDNIWDAQLGSVASEGGGSKQTSIFLKRHRKSYAGGLCVFGSCKSGETETV